MLGGLEQMFRSYFPLCMRLLTAVFLMLHSANALPHTQNVAFLGEYLIGLTHK